VTLIAGRYQQLENARRGSPLRARDLQTAQTVLLRQVSVSSGTGEDALRRAKAASGIFHPSLITLFDAVPIEPDQLLLAYEFVPAQTIAQLSAGQPLSAKRAAAVVGEIADAVAEIHARDVTHGGISQATVLVTMKGKARLDRLGDPTVVRHMATVEHDLQALGDLLHELAGSLTGAGVPGLQALEVIVNRARAGKFESAATLAAMLRKLASPDHIA
jgi:hypothetical protein